MNQDEHLLVGLQSQGLFGEIITGIEVFSRDRVAPIILNDRLPGSRTIDANDRHDNHNGRKAWMSIHFYPR